jgi:hypothetical protein
MAIGGGRKVNRRSIPDPQPPISWRNIPEIQSLITYSKQRTAPKSIRNTLPFFASPRTSAITPGRNPCLHVAGGLVASKPPCLFAFQSRCLGVSVARLEWARQ